MAISGRGAVSFDEWQNGYSESHSADGSQVTRACNVASTNVGKFIVEMLGSRVRDGENIATKTPDQVPRYPDLYAQSVELVQTIGPPNEGGPLNSFDTDNYLFHVHYGTVPFDIYDDAVAGSEATLKGNPREQNRYIERNLETSVENIQLPGGSMSWTSAPTDAIPGNASKTIFTMTARYTWHRVPELPIENIKNSLGRINSADFDVGHMNFLENTVLMLSAEIEKTWAPNQSTAIARIGAGGASLPLSGLNFQREYRITYTFLIRDNGVDTALTPNEQAGHQHLFRANTNKWTLVTHNGNVAGNRIYPVADHNNLFKLSNTLITF